MSKRRLSDETRAEILAHNGRQETLEMIADAVGCSKASVSRVLRGAGFVGGVTPRRLTDETRNEMVVLRRRGLTYKRIAEEVSWSETTVARTACAAGLGSGPRSVVADSEKAAFVTERRAGKSASEIARSHGAALTTVRRTLHRAGVPPQPYGQRCYALDETAFDRITDEVAYWVGFIFADGCVMPNPRRWRLSVSAHCRDAAHLSAMLRFLGSDQTPEPVKGRPTVQLQITSKRLVEALTALGVEPRKSFGQPRAAGWLAERAAFWAGMVDGDGTVGVRLQNGRPSPVVTLYGSRGLLEQYCRFLRASVYEKGARTPGVRPHAEKLFRVSSAGRSALRVLAVLSTSPVRLERKARRGQELIERFSDRGCEMTARRPREWPGKAKSKGTEHRAQLQVSRGQA